MIPISGTACLAQCPISVGGCVPEDIWKKIISIIFESNSGWGNATLVDLKDNPLVFVCKAFNRMTVLTFGQTIPLFSYFSSYSASPIEEKTKEVLYTLFPIHCDQQGNRYFRSFQDSTQLVVRRGDGSFDALELQNVFDINEHQMCRKLPIHHCIRNENDLIVVSSNIVTLLKLDPMGKFIILEGEKYPQVSKYIHLEEGCVDPNIFLYRNRLFRRALKHKKFFMCDLSQEKLKWVELKFVCEASQKIPENANFLTINGDLYLSSTQREKFEETFTLQTTDLFIPLAYDSDMNTLTTLPAFFKIISNSAEYSTANWNRLTRSFDPTPFSEHLFPTTKRWMVDGRQQNLLVIDLETQTEWIGTQANIRSPDPLKQEAVFLDNDLLLIFYSDGSFRACYLPTRQEVTRRLKSLLKPFLIPNYTILSLTFTRIEKETLNVCLQQMPSKKKFECCTFSQEVITKHFTLKEVEILKDELPAVPAGAVDEGVLDHENPPFASLSEEPLSRSSANDQKSTNNTSSSNSESDAYDPSGIADELPVAWPLIEKKEPSGRLETKAPLLENTLLNTSVVKASHKDSRCRKINQLALLALVSIAVIGATLVGIFALMGRASLAPQFMKSLSGALTPAYLPYIFISTTPAYLLILAIGYAIHANRTDPLTKAMPS